VLAVCALVACGAVDDATDNRDDAAELGSASLALETATPTHTYRLNGNVQVWRDGVQRLNVDLTGAAAAISIPGLTAGEYYLYLENPFLTRDGVSYGSTLVGPNPFPVEVAAGAVTSVPITFTVVGDPAVVFDPGAINLSVSVTEVPPP
jgi:hypothetical protein